MEDISADFSDPRERDRFIEYVKTLRGRKVIHIESQQYIRSLPLNNYWHGVVLQKISESTGHTIDELHDIFVESMLPLVTFRDYQDLTTTNISMEDMWKFALKVRHFAMRFGGIDIPDPENVIRPRHQPWPRQDYGGEFEKKND